MAKPGINYDEPFRLDVLFKAPPDGLSQKIKIYKQDMGALWDDIVSVRTYPFFDEQWGEYSEAEKFFITMKFEGTFVCVGEFRKMYNLWKDFRREYYGKNSNL